MGVQLESRLKSSLKSPDKSPDKSLDKSSDKSQLESGLESEPGLRADSELVPKVLRLLSSQPMSKAALAASLDQKRSSGPFRQVVQRLLAKGLIEYTAPDRPRSRLQQYRLTDMGVQLESRLKSSLKSPDKSPDKSLDKSSDKSQLESGLESQLESELESELGLWADSGLVPKVLRLLSSEPMSKAALAASLDQKRSSGPFRQVVQRLLAKGLIEYTAPDRPRSRLQQYRLTDMGVQLESRLTSSLKSPDKSLDKSSDRSELESQLESEPDLQADSELESRVLGLLTSEPMSKAALAASLGQKRSSGPFRQVVQRLLAKGLIEYTAPDRPRSRLQQYRLTDMGVQLESRLTSQLESQLESADPKARRLAADQSMSKLDRSRDLRQEDVSGRLNDALRPLPTVGTIEQMVPDQASDRPPEHRLTATTTRKRPESQSESRPKPTPESQPDSLEAKVLGLLASKPMSKAHLSRNLGQKEVSGQLNKVVRSLLADGLIEYTVPDKPQSRLQKYRLTAKGVAGVANAKTARVEP